MKTADELPILLLAIDDDPQSLEFVKDTLAQENLEILTTTDPELGLELVLRRHPQIVLLDLMMPKIRGMELLERILEADPGTNVMLMTGHYSTEAAVEAIQKGAYDYLNKPLSVEKLRQRVDQLMAEARQRRRTLQLDRELLKVYEFEGLLGRSPLMLDVFPRVRKVDVRVVAATNRDLRARVADKEFRDDLYYRLSMVEVKLPLLAERKEDLPLLVRYLVERFATQYNKPIRGLTRRAQALLARYMWPGNVRELENALGHACMMVEGDLIDVRDFPDTLRKPAERELVEDEDLIPLDELQRRHALRVLARVGGNKKRAAEILGIARTTLYQLLAESGAEQKETEQIKP